MLEDVFEADGASSSIRQRVARAEYGADGNPALQVKDY